MNYFPIQCNLASTHKLHLREPLSRGYLFAVFLTYSTTHQFFVIFVLPLGSVSMYFVSIPSRITTFDTLFIFFKVRTPALIIKIRHDTVTDIKSSFLRYFSYSLLRPWPIKLWCPVVGSSRIRTVLHVLNNLSFLEINLVFLFQQKEFEWILTEEVHAVLNQLHIILVVSSSAFFDIVFLFSWILWALFLVHSSTDQIVLLKVQFTRWDNWYKFFMLQECVKRFPLPLYGIDPASNLKQEKYVLTSPPDQLRTVISVNGDSIAHAVIQFL